MQHGCPIVVSDIPIFREIASDAGSYFDPESPIDFAKSIQQLQQFENWREASAKSKKRQAEFSWERSASELLKVLEAL
jgi:glycosyltransferase involved in cell wall biosynthesis